MNEKQAEFDEAILVRYLRESLLLTEEQASDEKILEITKNTFLRARIELGIACDNLVQEIKRAIKDDIAWIGRCFRGH